jgi:K+/H+ antiporter YhaU regulatory subunit KhtT
MGNNIVYKSVQDSKIRQKHKVSIVAILRQNNLISEIQADTLILPDDVLYLIGKNTDINNFINLVK